MDDEDRVIRIDDKDDLQEPFAGLATSNEIPLIALNERIRRTGAANEFFRCIGSHAVTRKVFFIPFVPAKLHLGSSISCSN